jgi:hypothetical protein
MQEIPTTGRVVRPWVRDGFLLPSGAWETMNGLVVGLVLSRLVLSH